MLGMFMRYGPEATMGTFRGGAFNHHLTTWGGNPGFFWVFGILWILTWLLFAALMIALIRWLWKIGDKIK